MKKIILLVSALAASIGLAAVAPAAFATEDCAIVYHNGTEGWNTTGSDDTTPTDASAVMSPTGGVMLKTTGTADKVRMYFPIDIALKDVTYLQFSDVNTEGLPASGQLVWDPDNDPATWNGTLVWETSYQATTPISPYDMYEGGNAQWWSTKDVTVGSSTLVKNTPSKLSDLIAMFPDTRVSSYGLNVGAGGQASTNVVDNLVIKAGAVCHKDRWLYVAPTTTAPTSTPTQGGGSNTASPTATATTSPAVTVSTTSSQSASTSLSPTGGDTSIPVGSLPSGESLPVTGTRGVPYLLSAAVGLILAGLGLLIVVARNRRAQEE